jgi:hypothetical protein
VKVAAWIFAVVAAIAAFGVVGAMIASAVPADYHLAITCIGYGCICLAVAGYWLHQNHWRAPPWLSKQLLRRLNWTLAIAGFLLVLIFEYRDPTCYVDWDGRANLTVCE